MKKGNVFSARLILIFCMLIVCLFSVSSTLFGQQINFNERFSKQSASLEISSAIKSQILCSNGDLRLQVSITIKNLQSTPIVFCKDCMTDIGVFVSINLTSLYQDKFVYDLDSFGEGRSYKKNTYLPDEKPFVTLKSGEKLTIQLEPYLLNFSGEKAALKAGNYIFVQTISTWADTTELADKLRIQWKNQGLSLWINNLITDPIALQVKEDKAETCQ